MDAPGDAQEYRYWAFISYSHRDNLFARRLHRELETYPIPKKLVGRKLSVGTVPRRLAPIFLDRDELPGSSDLSEQIQAALRVSRYLIVICSPASARSRYVREEITGFKALGRSHQVLTIIVSGRPESPVPEEECFSEALRFCVGADGKILDLPAHPLACDARPEGDGFRNAKLKLIAGICGVTFDEIRQRDVERRLRLAQRLVAVLLLIIGVIALLSVQLAHQRNRARLAEKHTSSVLAVSDVREGLRLLETNLADQALAYFSRSARTDATATRGARLLASLLTQQAWYVRLYPDLRHKGSVLSARFDPTGSRILTGSLDQTARLWDAATGQPVGDPLPNAGDVVDAQFHPTEAAWSRPLPARRSRSLMPPLERKRESRGPSSLPSAASLFRRGATGWPPGWPMARWRWQILAEVRSRRERSTPAPSARWPSVRTAASWLPDRMITRPPSSTAPRCRTCIPICRMATMCCSLPSVPTGNISPRPAGTIWSGFSTPPPANRRPQIFPTEPRSMA
jgi:hypothetical protein